jgi:hypothetical protein
MSGALVISAMLLASSTFDGGAPGGPVQRGAAALRLELAAPVLVRSPERLALHDARLKLADDRAPAEGGEAEPLPSADRTRTLRRWERALKWSTAGALVATSTLGTIAAVNQPTIFGDGRCQTGHAVLGTYGCDRGLSTLHGTSGVVAATLYTANGVLGLAIPGPKGNVSKSERPWHRALTYVHLGGIVLQPLLGLVSAYPQMIGVRDTAPVDPFPKNLRTAHVFLGYVTTAAFLTTLALEQ